MADVVRLSVVYETSQAAARIAALDAQVSDLGASAKQSQVAFSGWAATTRTLDSEISKFNATAQKSRAVFSGSNDRWASTSEIMASMSRDAGKVPEALARIGNAAPPTGRALNVIKNGMSTLAFQAAGVPGPLGKISTALLSMAGGSGLVLGVVAGLGAIAIAYNALTKGAREAEKATQELIAAQLKQRDADRSMDIRNREALATLKERMATARQELAANQAADRFRSGVGQGVLTSPQTLAAQRELNNALMAYNRVLREVNGLETAAAREARLKREHEERLLAIKKEQLRVAQITFAMERRLFDMRTSPEQQAYERRQVAPLRITAPGRGAMALVPDLRSAGQLNARELDDLAGTDAIVRAEREAAIEWERLTNLWREGLQSISDSLLDALRGVDGAFSQLLDHLFAMLYRDFTGNIIDRIVSAAVPIPHPVSGGPLGSSQPVGEPGPNLQMNFNVATPDAAAWIDQNGDRIAAAAARKIGNSRALRTKARIR